MKGNCRRSVPAAFAALVFFLALASPAAPVGDEALQRLGLETVEGIIEAPDFVLPTLNGASMSLAEHRGHVVILNFWTTW